MASLDGVVKQFAEALQNLERTRDVKPVVALFAEDGQIRSIALRKPLEGASGIGQFWTDYLSMFKQVQSTFSHVHTTQDLAVLEWTSEGILQTGEKINYQGVSILEFSGEKISRFRTYYDSAAFLPDGAKLLGREVEES